MTIYLYFASGLRYSKPGSTTYFNAQIELHYLVNDFEGVKDMEEMLLKESPLEGKPLITNFILLKKIEQ